MSRARTISTVAAGPIEVTVGRQAISQVPSVMSASDQVMPALRPRLLAICPMMIAPSGRMTKPAPKVASDSSSEDSGLCDEEKFADDDGGEAVNREVVRNKRVTDDGSQDDAGGSCFWGLGQVVCCGVHECGLGGGVAHRVGSLFLAWAMPGA